METYGTDNFWYFNIKFKIFSLTCIVAANMKISFLNLIQSLPNNDLEREIFSLVHHDVFVDPIILK